MLYITCDIVGLATVNVGQRSLWSKLKVFCGTIEWLELLISFIICLRVESKVGVVDFVGNGWLYR